MGKIRSFASGATRESAVGKLDYEGFLSPLVVKRFAEYMHASQVMTDGSTRASDNWQKGIPQDEYMKSLWRHLEDVWLLHRGWAADEDIETALCGVLFNAMGYLHERLKQHEATEEPLGWVKWLARETQENSEHWRPACRGELPHIRASDCHLYPQYKQYRKDFPSVPR